MSQHRSDGSVRVQGRAVRAGLAALLAMAVMAPAVSLTSVRAAPVELPARPVLPFALAQKIADAAIQKARTIPATGVIAIVDDAGEVILQIRMDNAFMRASSRLAPEKARSAVMFRRSTATLETAIAGPRPALATAPGFVMLKGGEPIIINGQLVGGIGVSVDTPDHDEDIAQAGLAAIK
ncbi:heme-binding protein [Acetobacter sp. TBRC 12305]|uniref:Heme-binding protein n=1 Tax=Acetobacter garciniae TaxID=2817435 RepID=A0A939HJ93_9PROT|nr:heme-binding protein [Acetobacter garciniae]MBO1325460.1 heme-binding protein [Acetobacter garciniae]MBX0345368.1 heme-binding protein [Acetobacter garciniae]